MNHQRDTHLSSQQMRGTHWAQVSPPPHPWTPFAWSFPADTNDRDKSASRHITFTCMWRPAVMCSEGRDVKGRVGKGLLFPFLVLCYSSTQAQKVLPDLESVPEGVLKVSNVRYNCRSEGEEGVFRLSSPLLSLLLLLLLHPRFPLFSYCSLRSLLYVLFPTLNLLSLFRRILLFLLLFLGYV